MHDATPVSVIMATYNRAGYIQAALESLLQQNYGPMDLIVVDDGSTDGTAAVVQSLSHQTATPLRYVRQENRGHPAALNHGLSLAGGPVISFLDSDDLWAADRLPAQLAFFANGDSSAPGEIGIVLGRKQYFADGVSVDEKEMARANQRPFHYSLAAALIARWAFEKVGPFDETVGFVADWDWFARARRLNIPTAVDPRVTLLGRIHAGNMTQNRALGAHLTVEMIRRHLNRGRGAADLAEP
jgi:glycosyltransferase involved in cell wall biosynthesis